MADDRSIEDAISEQAKGYNEIRQKLGAFTGAPEEYELTMPEGVDMDLDTESEGYQKFIELAKNSNMNNETANQLFQMYVEAQHEQFNNETSNREEQMALLGDKAQERIGNVLLGPETT